MDWSTLTASDWISFWSVLVTLFTSLVAIGISLMSLMQNKKIIREANAPKLFIYANQVSTGFYGKYIVVKNFGTTETTIKEISFSDGLCDLDKEFLNNLKGSTIMPGQKIVSSFVSDDKNKNLPNISIDVSYTVYKKIKLESYVLDIKRLKKTFYASQNDSSSSDDEIASSIYKLTNAIKNFVHANDKQNL